MAGFGSDDSLADMGFNDVQSGEQYESTIGFPISNSTKPNIPEQTVRPWQAFQERRAERLQQLRQPPDEEVTATACWGGLGEFEIADAGGSGLNGFNIKNGDKDDNDPAPDDPIVEEWNEKERGSVRIRVESEEDPEVYVKILVATISIMQLPSLTVSRSTTYANSSKNVTQSFTIPQRNVRIRWLSPGDRKNKVIGGVA